MKVEALAFSTREDTSRSVDPAPSLTGPAVENVYFGSIAVVSVDGRLLHWVGDPEWPTFTRSTLKPFQALPFVREGGPARFGWSSREVALMCASHSGEAMHTGIVRSMLGSADCDESCLQCGAHVPGWYAAVGKTPPAGTCWSAVEHNCSGKHAGFLAACRLHDESFDDYLDPASPLQRRIAAAIADQAGLPPDAMPRGTDGCSAPNYRLPLSRLALLYARLAQGRAAPRDGESLEVLFDAMTRHPELVSGTARSDLSLMAMAPGDRVTKIGADGVQAIGVRSLGIGIAIKVADGDRDALFCAVLEVLRQLNLSTADVSLDASEDETRHPWHRTVLRNARDRPIGRILPAFSLHAA